MPKILHILSGDLWGGSEAQSLVLLTELRQRGWAVEVLLFNAGEVLKRYTDAGFACTVIPESQGFVRWAGALIRKFRGQPAADRPSVLVAHGYKESFAAFILSNATGIPWISVFHGLTEAQTGAKGAKMQFYRKLHLMLSINSARFAVTVSKQLGIALGLSKSKRWRVVLNACPKPQSSAEHAATEATGETPPLQSPAIVCIGRLVPVKRLDRAMEAFDIVFQQRQSSGLPLPHLYFAGTGPIADKLVAASKRLGSEEHIHFLGFRSDTQWLIADADAACISSDSEGIPTVLLEAIQAETPVATTPVGGIPEVAEALSGCPIFLAASVSTEALADALQQALTSGAVTSTGTWKENFEKLFSPTANAAGHEAMYREILGG